MRKEKKMSILFSRRHSSDVHLSFNISHTFTIHTYKLSLMLIQLDIINLLYHVICYIFVYLYNDWSNQAQA